MIDMFAKFGVAGSPDDFYDQGNKNSIQMPKYLKNLGLDIFEYQCGRGVNISTETANKLRDEAKAHGIIMTVHSPYYINIATSDDTKKNSSLEHIMKTLRAAKDLGGERIVVHMGSASDDRQLAMENSRKFIPFLMKNVENEGLENIKICFETMGKVNQLGTLEETIEICALDDRLLPTIDFGHLHARTHGSIKQESDYLAILDYIINNLGEARGKAFHSHFSKILWTAGGESKHLTFEDKEYGPEFEPLASALVKRDCHPYIICESRGTQGIDALFMKEKYLEQN